MTKNKNDFFADKITFNYPGEVIGEEEIDEIDDFPGKEDFINFYITHNGGDFTYGAWFFPEDCYKVSRSGDPYITLGVFLPIPTEHNTGEFKEVTMEDIKDSIVEKYSDFEDFVLFHIPFALDVTDNPFWIDIQSGEIKYTDFEESHNPDDAITVASSFKEFCKRIENRKI